MKCCENCFVDKYLKRRIQQEKKISNCDFCQSTNVSTIEASGLYENFVELLELYEPVQYGEHYHPEYGTKTEAIDAGDPLPQIIQDEWGDIFNYDKLNLDKQCDILDEIRVEDNDDTSSNDLWAPKDQNFLHVSEDELWYNFCQHIKHHRRFIFESENSVNYIADPKDWLPNLLPDIEQKISPGTLIYRARLNPPEYKDKPLEADKMGALSCEKAISGRTNPHGISVLYAALEPDTAISEVRPDKGAMVTYAILEIKKSIRVVNLIFLPLIPNPFVRKRKRLAEMISHNNFFRSLDKALSKPIQKNDREIDYVPTQYIAEVIKNASYDGILYKSSLKDKGGNIVLFDPNIVDIAPKTELIKITGFSVSFERISPNGWGWESHEESRVTPVS